jgi:hypothetical protein
MRPNQALITDWCSNSRQGLMVEEAGGGTSTATRSIVPIEPVNTHTRFRQSRIDNRRFNNNEPWGDNITLPPVKSVRLGFRNIYFLPAAASDDRNEALCRNIAEVHIDVMGVSEVNIAWQHLDYNSQPQSRFRKNFEQSKWICANNRTDNEGLIAQRGGTMMGTINATSNRVIKMGIDTRNLGRWCWCLLQGKEHMLLICTVYRSCATRGVTTSYSQQKRTLMNSGITNCPRSQFWDDLKAELVEWHGKGYHMVVGGDFNEYVEDTFITSFFGEFGMKEAIVHKCGSPSPNTYIDGTVPIDGVFCTRSLDIKAAGYTPIFFGIKTDHRLVWIDISLESAFGTDSHLFKTANARKLQLDQPNVVNQYLGHRMYLLKKNQLHIRTVTLHAKVCAGNTGLAIILELEKLDRLRASDMLTSECRCRKIKAGQVAWSPTLQKSIEIIRYLRLVIAARKGNGINSRTLVNALARTTLDTAVYTLDSALELLMAEKITYKNVKANAEGQRKSFLRNLADDKASESGQEPFQILKQLQQREEQRSLARQLHRIKGSTKCALNELQVSKDGEWHTVTDKMAIEQECMVEGKKRFIQANNTPSLTSDQIDLLGWTAHTDESSLLLQGSVPTNLHSDIKHIASYLQHPTTVLDRPKIESVMTLEQYQSGWAKAKERTSSGTSGLHFGHFKANSLLHETVDIDLKILQMTIMLGYSLLRWRSAVDVMIPKKADSKRADQLRVICLMEPDFNYMNKWMGKITMANAEASNSIASEQFGSRKHKSAIQHALNKALCFDTLRTMKDDASLTVLDAKSCYDRIPPPLACLCLRQQGLPQNIIDASFNTIKDMTHHIRTAYGISQVSYERDDDSYMHGILQGNGAGPCIWVMLSSPILNMLAEQGNGAVLNLPDGQTIKVVAFAFVDDIDLIQKLPKINPLFALQHDFNLWDKGLQTISGALVWEKCDVYLLQNIWDDRLHHWTLADQSYCPGSINIMHDGTLRAITRKEPNVATLSLGVMFAPSGNMKDQVTHLRKKADAWADLLRVKRIAPTAVWYSLTASIMKTIEYPLLATSMSQKDLTYIMAPILLSALPRAKTVGT